MKPDWTPEQKLQADIVDFLDVALPPHAIFNATNPVPAKSKAAAGKSKRMGLRAGWPDLVVVCGDTIWMEVKHPKARSLPRYQRELHGELTQAGGAVYTVRSIEDVDRVLRSHGVEMRGELV